VEAATVDSHFLEPNPGFWGDVSDANSQQCVSFAIFCEVGTAEEVCPKHSPRGREGTATGQDLVEDGGGV
jgi:hypothetical protein